MHPGRKGLLSRGFRPPCERVCESKFGSQTKLVKVLVVLCSKINYRDLITRRLFCCSCAMDPLHCLIHYIVMHGHYMTSKHDKTGWRDWNMKYSGIHFLAAKFASLDPAKISLPKYIEPTTGYRYSAFIQLVVYVVYNVVVFPFLIGFKMLIL